MPGRRSDSSLCFPNLSHASKTPGSNEAGEKNYEKPIH